MLQVEVVEGAHLLLRRPIGKYDNVLVGPSPDAEVQTDRVSRMIPMIRASPGGKGWELVYPTSLPGHVTSAGRTRTLAECARDATARTDGDLAVFPLPDGAVGGIELGELRVRFREVPDADATTVLPPPADEADPTAIGIASVTVAFVLIALLVSPRPAAVRDAGDEIAIATPAPTATRTSTGAGGTPRPVATTTALAVATPAPTARRQLPLGIEVPWEDELVEGTPAPAATTVARASATPTAGTPIESPTAVALATPTASSKPVTTPTPTPGPSVIAEATPTPTARPAATPQEHDPLALAVSSPRATPNPKASPVRTPPSSGFLDEVPLESDDRFTERLDAVPTMTPPRNAFTLEDDDSALTGSIVGGAYGTGGGTVRDGGKGLVGDVEVGPAGTGDMKVASAGKVETPVEAKLHSSVPLVSGTIDVDRVAAVVQEASGAFRACYEAALRRNTRISGKVVLSWRIVQDGAAEDIQAGSSTLQDAEVERCLVTRVRRLRFPRPDGGAVSVEYPMVFYAAVETN